MKKKTRNMALRTLIFVAVISLAISGSVIAAVGHPSAKATCKIADITLIDAKTDLGWTTLLSNTIKTANSLHCYSCKSVSSHLHLT